MPEWNEWNFRAPTPADLGDHDVLPAGAHLAGRRVALLGTGSIAAMKMPLVARALRAQGAEVVAFVSQEALRYVAAEALEWSTTHKLVHELTAAAEHLSDSAPFDAYLLAPATYNSINKIAAGIADSVVTSAMASALGRLAQGRAAVLLAPAMHGSLHNDILVRSLRLLHEMGVRVIPPRDAYGKHNLPDEQALVAEVARAVSRSPLRTRRVLVTGGAPALPLSLSLLGDGRHDLIRHRPTGLFGLFDLGSAIASELHLRGAAVTWIAGGEAAGTPGFLTPQAAPTHAEYQRLVGAALDQGCQAAVFAAATVTCRPETPASGPATEGTLTLIPAADLGERLRRTHPDLPTIALSYQDRIPSGPDRLADGPDIPGAATLLGTFSAVVACSGDSAESAESNRSAGSPLAVLLTPQGPPRPLADRRAIAEAVADHLEGIFRVA